MGVLLHVEIIIISNYKKKVVQNNLIIRNKFQLFKIFAQMVEQFLHILLLKIKKNFLGILTVNFSTIEL